MVLRAWIGLMLCLQTYSRKEMSEVLTLVEGVLATRKAQNSWRWQFALR